MLPTRLTQAVAAAAVLLLIVGLLLDDPAYIFTAGSLLAILFAAAGGFLHNVRTLTLSVQVTRTAAREIVRQGNPVSLTTKVRCLVPVGTRIKAEDILPAAAKIAGGENHAGISPGGEAQFTYQILPAVHGKMQISAIRIGISDRFFHTSFDLSAGRYTLPEFQVQPRPYFETLATSREFGGRETDRVSIYHGFGIRSHREYVIGDDLKNIDWKLSAKHQKMYVKEYCAAEQFPPLLILDLPSRDSGSGLEELRWLASRVTGDMERTIGPMGSVSLILISGINIIDILLEERSLSRAVSLVREKAHPVHRLHSAYHMKTRAGIRMFQKKTSRLAERIDDQSLQEFLNALSGVSSVSLVRHEIPAFEAQADRLFQRCAFGSVRIYSLLDGDASHIGILLTLARALKLKTRIITPAAQENSMRSRFVPEFGSELVEVTQ